jgi:hypothetical protein
MIDDATGAPKALDLESPVLHEFDLPMFARCVDFNEHRLVSDPAQSITGIDRLELAQKLEQGGYGRLLRRTSSHQPGGLILLRILNISL